MRIQRLDPAAAHRAYGILCQGVDPWRGAHEPPFGATWCTVEPGGTARAHRHQEHEAFVIVRGRGTMRVEGESAEVGPGDVVFMEPFESHELVNGSADDELLFLDLCWEVMAEAIEANRGVAAAEAGAGGAAERARDVLVTATPPTPNGDLHCGHLAGPYLAADAFARYRRLRGGRALYLSGADDHQSYVPAKARQLGGTAREVADRFGETMAGTLERAGVALDHWGRPKSSPHHRRMVEEVFRTLWQRGAIVERERPFLWCESCRLTLFEAHVVGRCPHCGAGSNGNACEQCARPHDCPDLVDARCRHCGGEPVLRPAKRLFFPLAPYAGKLAEWWERTEMSPHLRSLCDAMLAEGLPEIAVSHRADWGIPVPVAGFEDQVIYVWFEMGPGYLAAAQELAEARGIAGGWRSLWASDEVDVVQFFGFDNGYFHALLFPATFLAYDPGIRLPKAFVVNEFYRYEGSKFSTSRNHAMWGRELLDRVPRDVARFYLAWDAPEREQTNFTLAELEATAARELAGSWEPWLAGLGGRIAGEFDGAVPGTGAWTAEHRRFFATLGRLTGEAAAAYEAATFSPQRAARVLCELVREARRFAAAEEPWRGTAGRFEERRTAVALEALAAKTLALLAAPLMPDFAERLWRDLGFDGTPERHGWPAEPTFVPSGQSVAGLDRAYFRPAREAVLATA